MNISLLPDELRIELNVIDAVLWEGLVAVVRPLDIVESSRWIDAFPGDDTVRHAAVVLVKEQMIRVEGAAFNGVPYDRTNPAHFLAVFASERKGAEAIALIYMKLMRRSSLEGEAEKNSVSPSDSDKTSTTAN